ncbi:MULTISPECIES: hypothetical protein [unclassified Streptomyces]
MTGREYLRVSARGERSIPEQRDDNTRAAEREGVALALAALAVRGRIKR